MARGNTAVGPLFGALFETQRDVKTETTLMSYVARRKLKCQQLEKRAGYVTASSGQGLRTTRRKICRKQLR